MKQLSQFLTCFHEIFLKKRDLDRKDLNIMKQVDRNDRYSFQMIENILRNEFRK